MWVPFLHFFPGNEAHHFLFWGPQIGGVLGGVQKVYVEKVYALFFRPLSYLGGRRRWTFLVSAAGTVQEHLLRMALGRVEVLEEYVVP